MKRLLLFLAFVIGIVWCVLGERLPPVQIKGVEFANVTRNGHIINDYGEEIIGKQVVCLAPKIEYEAARAGQKVRLDVKLWHPAGYMLRSRHSPDGYTYSVIFTTQVGGNIKEPLGRWRSDFGKGYRMEVYWEGARIFSDTIPTRGTLYYYPVGVHCLCPECRGRRFTYTRRPPEALEFVYKNRIHHAFNMVIFDWRIVEK